MSNLRQTDPTAELAELKRRIEEARNRRAGVEGELKSLERRLKDEFGCATVEAARIKLEKLQRESARLKTELEKGVAELREMLEA